MFAFPFLARFLLMFCGDCSYTYFFRLFFLLLGYLFLAVLSFARRSSSDRSCCLLFVTVSLVENSSSRSRTVRTFHACQQMHLVQSYHV